jgi:ketosteroid isomerase-like protein
MRGRVVATVLLLPLLVAGCCAARARRHRAEVAREVVATESRRVQALTGDDLARLEDLLSDDLTYTHSDGRVQSKAELLAALRSGAITYVDVQHADVRIGVYGDTAVLTGRSRLTVRAANGRGGTLPVRFTLVYVKEKGHWRMVAWQSTPIGP